MKLATYQREARERQAAKVDRARARAGLAAAVLIDATIIRAVLALAWASVQECPLSRASGEDWVILAVRVRLAR